MATRRAIRESKYLLMRALALEKCEPPPPVACAGAHYGGPLWATDYVMDRHASETDSVRKETLRGMFEDGFKIVPNAVPRHMVADLIRATESFQPNFRRHRISHDRKSGEFDIWAACHSLVSTFFCPCYLLADASFLSLEEGCTREPAHRDFTSDVHRWAADFPVAGVVALDENTWYVAFDSVRRYNGINETDDDLRGVVTPRHVALPPGAMVLWHGNLAHASETHPGNRNRRLYFSAVAPGDATSVSTSGVLPVTV